MKKNQPFLFLWCLIILNLLTACGTSRNLRLEPPPLTVPQIVALSRQGVPAEAIIARIHRSGLLYRLLPNQIERLRQAGVPKAVLDDIQRRYRLALKRHPYLEDWDNWTFYEGYWYARPGYGEADELTD